MSADSPGERTIAVVLYPGLTVLDLIGPLQVLKGLERFAPDYRTVVVGERAEPMDTDVHVRVIPDRTFDQVRHLYAVVVPGGRVWRSVGNRRPARSAGWAAGSPGRRRWSGRGRGASARGRGARSGRRKPRTPTGGQQLGGGAAG